MPSPVLNCRGEAGWKLTYSLTKVQTPPLLCSDELLILINAPALWNEP